MLRGCRSHVVSISYIPTRVGVVVARASSHKAGARRPRPQVTQLRKRRRRRRRPPAAPEQPAPAPRFHRSTRGRPSATIGPRSIVDAVAARCERLGTACVHLGHARVGNEANALHCVKINQCVGCTRQFFTKPLLGDGAAVLARSSGEERAPPRHRAGVASMAWRTTR